MASGVYVIRLKPTGQCYVGSTVRMASRWWQHRHALKRGRHHSPLLQKAWNTHGADLFEFVVVEEIAEHLRETFKDREQHYIDTLKSDFNFQREAYVKPEPWHHTDQSKAKTSVALKTSAAFKAYVDSRRGVKRPGVSAKMKGRPKPEGFGAKISAAQKGVPAPGRSAAQKGKPRPWQVGTKRNAETKAKMAEARRNESETTKARRRKSQQAYMAAMREGQDAMRWWETHEWTGPNE